MIRIIENRTSEGLEYLDKVKDRGDKIQKDVIISVDKILEDVKNKKDEAIVYYNRKFDSENFSKDDIEVKKEEIDKAYSLVDEDFINAINLAKENIYNYHKMQKRTPFINVEKQGTIIGQNIRGLESVGIYVPGGTAAYPSSVLMNAIPAKVAGVDHIYMVTPTRKDMSISPYILVAADIAGVDKIYKVGGAQGIGALAFGTETIPKVDKIVGPGNIFVAMAKRSVYGYVDIDMIAGPSEILIISDETGDPAYIAADLMSQAEHDVLASSILITTSMDLANAVNLEVEKQIKNLERKDIIEKSLKDYGSIIIVEDIKKAIELANAIAPEHLEVMVTEPFLILGQLKNAGSIFLGKYSPEPLGDYMAGPNHVLPTSGSARFFSPLSVDDFIKKSSYIYYTKEALSKVADPIQKIASVEGLTAHGNSIKVRFLDDK